jgi:hypothetical protein
MYDYNIISTPIKPQDKWTLFLFPYGIDWDGTIKEWSFSLSEYMIINEQFTNGTQNNMSHWYKELTGHSPTHKSMIKMEISKDKPHSYTTKWIYQSGGLIPSPSTTPGSSWYQDEYTKQMLWLCPLWTMMIGQPQDLYIKYTTY